MLSIPSISTAQSHIGSFYGMKLGDNAAAVESGVKSQGKTGIWKTNDKGARYYHVSSPILGGCKFESVNFGLKGGVLNKAVFNSWGGGSYDIEHPTGNTNYKQCLSSARVCESNFKILRACFIDKYGNPKIETDNKLVWISGKNQLSLEFSFKDNKEFGSWRDISYSLYVTYEIRNINNNY